MKCQACIDDRHFDCGMQSWCECDCEVYTLDPPYTAADERQDLAVAEANDPGNGDGNE